MSISLASRSFGICEQQKMKLHTPQHEKRTSTRKTPTQRSRRALLLLFVWKMNKIKHAAQYHVPKCKGPSVTEGGNVTCLICMQSFNAQRILSIDERLVHSVVRNEKGEKAATSFQLSNRTRCTEKSNENGRFNQ